MAKLHCTYKREEGIHYPVGKPSFTYTQAEIKNKTCQSKGTPIFAPMQGIKSEDLPLWKDLLKANRTVRAPLFSDCFLQEVLDLSRTAGLELGVRVQENKLVAEVGTDHGMIDDQEIDKLKLQDYLFPLHTHPRATHRSPPATTYSFPDFHLQFYFSMLNQQNSVALVSGSVCGGPMEESLVAIAGRERTLYVYNEAQKIKVEGDVKEFYWRPEAIIGEGAELSRLGAPQRNIKVEVNPKRANELIEEYRRKYKITPELEQRLIEDFKTKLRAKKK